MGSNITVSHGDKAYFLNEVPGLEDTGFRFWLDNQEGEGMSLSEKNLFDLLDQYFKDNF